MALEQRLNLKLSQKLVMTQSLQQAIKLLQMSRLELVESVQQELLENPVLEEAAEYDDDVSKNELERKESEADAFEKAMDQIDVDAYFQDYLGDYQPQYQKGTFDISDQPPFENMVTKPESLREHLEKQLGLLPLNEAGFEIGMEIIGNVDDDGYLVVTLEEIAEETKSTLDEVEAVWRSVREFDPRGVAARNLRECLEIQIAYSEWAGTDVETLLLDHFDLLAREKYREIMSKLGIEREQLLEYLEIIKCFEPKPGRAYSPIPTQYIEPDVYIVKVDDEYVIQINDEGTPRLRVSPRYSKLIGMARKNDKEAAAYIKDKFKSAMWLIKSLDQRNRTIYKVAESLVRHQRDFLTTVWNI